MSKPSRMDGYVRVSRKMGRDGPGYISPLVQREAIQRWADYRGIEIVVWHVDEDESGGTQDRPGLRECMRRIEAHETDGIACWRLNRFARNVAGAIEDIDRVHAAGGHLAFVEEDIDPTGPFGSFILTILLAVATLERDNIVAGWNTAKARATDRGVKIGPTPFGYQRADDSCLEPDPIYAPIVSEAFQIASRSGLSAATAFMAEQDKGTWNASTVRRLLSKRSYLGEATYGELSNLKAHPPLVSRAVWEAAQPEPAKRRRPKATFPLSGLAICKQCGNALVGARGGAKAQRVYRCSAALATHKGERCLSATTVTAELLERLVIDAAIEALEGHAFEATDLSDALRTAEDALAEAERELDDLVSDLGLRSTLGPERFRKLAQSAVDAVEAAQRSYREAASASAAEAVVLSADLLREASLEDLGVLLRGLIEAIVVARGRTPLAGRVQIVAKGSPVPSVAR